MNPTKSTSTSSTITTYIEQPAVAQDIEQNDLGIGFFAIGAIVNIVMITAYFIWAYRQWGKTGKRDK